MTWRLNFVRSKDAQKQLARTSLNLHLHSFHMITYTYCGEKEGSY